MIRTMSPRRFAAAATLLLCAALTAVQTGCTSYRTPGRAADFRALGISQAQADQATDAQIAARLNRKPTAGFPTAIAALRVQGENYSSYTATGYGSGNYTVVTVRDVETDDQFARLAKMPMVRGIAPVNRFALPHSINTELDLRTAAANVQADMLLLYTFDTTFGSESHVPPLGVITLGLFPEREARVTSTASAAFIDTRTGYVYGLAEATASTGQLTNAWTDQVAIDQSRRRAESDAFEKLVADIEKTWPQIVQTYGPTDHASAAQPSR